MRRSVVAAVSAAVAAELVKIRSLRSTFWTLLASLVIAVGIGYLCCCGMRGLYPHLPAESQRIYDPLCPSLFSLTLAQLPVVVFSVLAVTCEYSTGMIRASLAAVPCRGVFYSGKLLATATVVLGTSLVILLTLFPVSRAVLGPLGASLGDFDTVLALLSACLYLVMISLISMGLAVMLRSATTTLTILLPMLFIGSQVAATVPGMSKALRFLPNQAGMTLFHVVGEIGEPWLGPGYDRWTALGILLAWTAAVVAGGYVALRRRDA